MEPGAAVWNYRKMGPRANGLITTVEINQNPAPQLADSFMLR